jgi:hypothetical protein
VIAQDNLPNGAVVEWTDYTLPSPRVYHSLFASWVVPDAPTSGYTASQTYFQYPALKVNDGWILQPVLIWGNGHQYYYYASYYCQISGTCFKVSSSLRASVYDLMNGTITFQGCVGTACTWKVETWDVTAGVNGKVSFSVVLQGNDPGTYNVAQGNAVETYNLQACTQYPLDGVQTTNLVMTDDQGNNVTPTWAPHVASGITPACQFTAPPVTAGIITLHHNVTTAISGPASPNTGSIATYTATGLGPSGHYFQWYRNDSLLSGQTASTLTFVPKLPIPFKLALKTTHVHTGVVDSIVGNYVGNFSLTINGPLTVHVGSSSCTWTVTHQGGISPLTYSWQWQGVDVSTTSSFSQDMSGYTAGSNFSLAVMVTDSTGTPRSLAKTVSVVSTGGTTCMG